MALQNLRTFFSEGNINDFQKMIELPCVVTEKIQASSFHVQRTSTGFNYFKSGSKTPMDLVDRTIVKYYENAIAHFESIVGESKEEMPLDWKFGFDYMTDSKTVNIKYDTIPKNNLMLSHIQVCNPVDSTLIKSVIRDPKILNKWADSLDVQRPQVLHQGKLSSLQKEQLVELMSSSDMEYAKAFSDSSFSRKIYNLFNPAMNSTALNLGVDGEIDSVIINFFEGRKVKTFKISEQERKEGTRKSSDMYQIALLDLVEYFTTYDIESLELDETKSDKRYIELISKLFNSYIEKNASKYIGVKFDSAEFSSSSQFELNKRFISNETTISNVSNSIIAELFKIALGSFRKKRSKETSIINSDLMSQINDIVSKIESVVMLQNNESNIMNFNTFLNHEGLKHQVSPITEALDVKYPEQGKTPVNMFVGRFQPFTLGHAKVIETISKQNGFPVVIILVKAKAKKKEDAFKRPYDEDLQIEMLNKLKSKYPIKDVYVIEGSAGIDKMFNAMRGDGYEPVLWGTGTDRMKNYGFQVNNQQYRDDLGVRDDFGLFEIPRTGKNISATQVRNAMLDGDEKLFKKLTPSPIHGMYSELKSRLEDSMGVVAESFNIESGILTFKQFTNT